MKEGFVKVSLDYAPKKNGKAFDKWCEKYQFYPLNSGRRAWCPQYSTYFRDAAGVAFTESESFIFYEDDLYDTPREA